MNKITLFGSTLIAIFFSGCISLTQELPPFTTYTLSIDSVQTKTPSLPHLYTYSIEVNEPQTLASINSKLLSYKNEKFQQEVYALSKWSDSPSKLLQNNMVNYLNSTDSYKLITSSKMNINTSHKLLSELDYFGQVFEKNTSYGVLDIRVYLVDSAKVESKRFYFKEACQENNAYGLVKTLNALNTQFVQQLHQWIGEKI